MRPAILLVALALIATTSAWAHRLSDACLRFQVTSNALVGRMEIPIRDLAEVVPLDANGDDAVTWGELRAQREAIVAHVTARVQLRSVTHEVLALETTDLRVADIAGEPCVSLAWLHRGPVPAAPIEIEYRLLAEVDPQHRGLVRWEDGGGVRTAVLGPEQPNAIFAAPEVTGRVESRWTRFVAEGLHHIWTGYDHLLFLLALLLPVAVRRPTEPQPNKGFLMSTLLSVLRIVTAFTLAHSITLVLAALGVVRLPSAPVEMAIAASVAVAALDNLVPVFRRHAVGVAFGFGLIHGFGFAGVLDELELPTARFVEALLGFNVGVELGQVAVVALFVPVAYALRETWVYRRVALPWGSAAILLIALFWFGERTLAAV